MIDCSAPQALVEEYERYQPPGDPGTASLLQEVTPAVAAHVEATTVRLFTDELPHRTADTIAHFCYLTGQAASSTLATAMLGFHGRALKENEPLASMLRSKEAVDLVAAASASGFEPHAASEASRRYRRGIAEQLVAAQHPLAAAAAALLAAELLADRLVAAQVMHQRAAAAAAEQAAAAARAAQEAADRQADEVEAARLLAERLRVHGLPETVTTGPFVAQQRGRLMLLATAKRRLGATPVDAIRLNLGQGRGLYTCRTLVNAIGEASTDELQALLGQLDAAEGRAAVAS